MMKRLLGVMILGGLVAAASPASAVPTLELWDGTTTLTCADGAGCDLSALAGVVVFSTAIGNWDVTVNTGITMPVLGSATDPHMDLNSVVVSNLGAFPGPASTLRIRFSEVGFGPVDVAMVASIGGTTGSNGTVAYNTYWDGSNALFGTANLLTSLGPFGPAAYSGVDVNPSVIPDGLFSLTQEVLISHDGVANRISSFDAELQPVPEPGTLLLIGSGLTGLALRRRRRV